MLKPYVKQTTTTAGTGDLTLVSITGFAQFLDAFAANATVLYAIENGDNKETGTGKILAGNILQRTTPLVTLVAGVYSAASPVAITLAGTSTVFCDMNAPASAAVSGFLSSTDWTTFNGMLPKAGGTMTGPITLSTGAVAVGGSGTINTIPKFTATGTIGNSSITDDGIDVTVTGENLIINGNITVLNQNSPFYSVFGSAIVSTGVPGAADTFVVGKSTTGTNSIRSMAVTAKYQGSNSAAIIQGLNSFAILDAAATVGLTSSVGGGGLRNRYITTNNGTGLTVAQQSSVSAIVNVTGSGSITTNASDYHAETPTVSAGNTITNFYGLWARGGAVSGTLTNRFGVYIDDLVGGTNRYGIYQAGSSELNYFAGPIKITPPIQAISTGVAPITGNATLVAGTVTVSTTAAKTTPLSIILLTRKTSGGTIGTSITYTINNGVSFTITSDNILDTSTFSYFIIDSY